MDKHTFQYFCAERFARWNLSLRNRLLFEASHELQCPYVLRPSCSGASTRRGRESLFFVTILYHKANYKKKVLNPRLITKRKKILPSLYMRGFNHVAVCLPQLELVNGMLAEINELKQPNKLFAISSTFNKEKSWNPIENHDGIVTHLKEHYRSNLLRFNAIILPSCKMNHQFGVKVRSLHSRCLNRSSVDRSQLVV